VAPRPPPPLLPPSALPPLGAALAPVSHPSPLAILAKRPWCLGGGGRTACRVCGGGGLGGGGGGGAWNAPSRTPPGFPRRSSTWGRRWRVMRAARRRRDPPSFGGGWEEAEHQAAERAVLFELLHGPAQPWGVQAHEVAVCARTASSGRSTRPRAQSCDTVQDALQPQSGRHVHARKTGGATAARRARARARAGIAGRRGPASLIRSPPPFPVLTGQVSSLPSY